MYQDRTSWLGRPNVKKARKPKPGERSTVESIEAEYAAKIEAAKAKIPARPKKRPLDTKPVSRAQVKG